MTLHKYTAQLGGQSWSRGPKDSFHTIRGAREWAESYGTTADWCSIFDRTWRLVGRHMRDPSGDGTRWYKAEV